MKLKKRMLLLLMLTFILVSMLRAQSSTYIDDNGVMRWKETKDEVCVFATNYAIPFSYWKYREPIGIDYEKAIDEDVYHIARLGIDGYRVHVWPDFITDSIGNLVFNQHLQLFDYLIYKLKQRNIKLFITPMYHSEEGDGFVSAVKGKNNCINDSTNWKYQRTYLSQFVSHVNPYTGTSLKDDKDVLAFAITNEPSHWRRPDLVTSYINNMMGSMRAAGVSQPIFYNMTTCATYIDDVLASDIQGGTFQWYPSGLTSNHDQKGNMLPNVDQYHIPFDHKLKESKRPKFVYEFSPSDIGQSSHVYPAMARSFREAGFQFAAHFAYDPLHAAYCNIEYRTHFLNFAYTPKKAIGFMIAAEAFHQIPLEKSYGRFPNNNTFGAFSLNYENDLAEMVTDKKFLYSNHTSTNPKNAKLLEKVAGTGNSPVVKYEGTGAYILDKLEDGVWRLEVMPDALWVRDPFYVPYVERETAVTLWKNHTMRIILPDLGNAFSIQGLNEGNTFKNEVSDQSFSISPGAYLITKEGVVSNWAGDDKWKNIQLNEFHAPTRKLEDTYVLHTPPTDVSAGQALVLSATIVAPYKPEKVELIVLGVGGAEVVPMKLTSAYQYEALIPEKYTKNNGLLNYHISIKHKNKDYTYPGGSEDVYLLNRRIYGDDRRISEDEPYQVRVVNNDYPLCLFDADKDWLSITKTKRKDKIDCFPSSIPGKAMMHIKANKLSEDEHDFSIRSYCKEKIENRMMDLKAKKELVIYGHSLNNKPCKLQIALVSMEGVAYGAVATLNKESDNYIIALKDLKRVKSVLLPHAYPGFQPYWFNADSKDRFDITDIESIQISIGPGISESDLNDKHGVAIAWINLQ